MSKNARFWRNVTLIALAHVALIAGLIRWSVEARSPSNAQSIVWLGDVGRASAAIEATSVEQPPAKLARSPEPGPQRTDEAEKATPLVTEAKSEIQLPTPKPAPTATATPKPTPPKATPKPTPKPKATPKKIALAKASPKSSPKVKPSPADSSEQDKESELNTPKKKIAKTTSAKKQPASHPSDGKGTSAGTSGAHAGGGSSASEFGWYGNMLHDRFYSAWIQPTTNIASGNKISTLVQVRIEKDGRVSNFEVIKPSENVVVNESVAAIAKRVTEVDPLPVGLGTGDHYDVKINFELNPEEVMAK
jgi:Gram-negative bacterial tonB protein.